MKSLRCAPIRRRNVQARECRWAAVASTDSVRVRPFISDEGSVWDGRQRPRLEVLLFVLKWHTSHFVQRKVSLVDEEREEGERCHGLKTIADQLMCFFVGMADHRTINAKRNNGSGVGVLGPSELPDMLRIVC